MQLAAGELQLLILFEGMKCVCLALAFFFLKADLKGQWECLTATPLCRYVSFVGVFQAYGKAE